MNHLKIILIFLIIKPTRCISFLNLCLQWNSTCFGHFLCPSSGVFSLYTLQWYMSYRFADSLRASCQQTCMTYTIAVFTVKNSWWCIETLFETCWISFEEQIWEISASIWFYYKKLIMVHGHMNVKLLYYYYQHQYNSHCDYRLLLLSMFYIYVIPPK